MMSSPEPGAPKLLDIQTLLVHRELGGPVCEEVGRDRGGGLRLLDIQMPLEVWG